MRLVIPRAAFRPALVLALATGLTATAIPLTATAAGSSSSARTYQATDVGTAPQVSTVARSSARVASTQPRGVRQLPRSARAAAARPGAAPLVASSDALNSQSSGDNGSSGRLLRHFNGVSSLDSEVTNFGAK